MKKTIHIILITALLSGCSSLAPLLQIAPTPTPAPPTETFTPAPTVTHFPTQDLFATATFTVTSLFPTSDAVEEPTLDPSKPTEPPTPLPTFAPPQNTGNVFTPKNEGFLAILISNNVLYWNEGPCMPREVKFAAFVTDLLNTDMVLLFMRLREKKNTLNLTDWGSGAIMSKANNGSFTYTVTPKNISKYYKFKDAWVEFQLVAFNADRLVIGRTQVYERNVSLVRCMPIP